MNTTEALREASRAEYRVEGIQKANLNGRKVKLFRAYRNSGTCFEFVGQFSAPIKTPNKSLWQIAENCIGA